MTTARLFSPPTCLIALVVLIPLAAGCNQSAALDKPAAVSGPETATAALQAFIDGLKKEDVDKALSVHVNPERARAAVASQVQSITVANRFRLAAHEKFGAREFIPLVPTVVSRYVQSLKSSPPVEEGDKASWAFSEPEPMVLVRKDGIWFIDWSSLSDEKLKGMSSDLDASSAIIESICEEIESDKFRNMTEMANELREKLMNAEQQPGNG